MNSSKPTVLVPVDASDPETYDRSIVNLFQTAKVIILGWYPVPDQSAPSQLRNQFEDEAKQNIADLKQAFETADIEVETLVAFSHSRPKSVDKAAEQTQADFVLTPGKADQFDRIVVSIRGEVNLTRITSVVGPLLSQHDGEVTIFGVIAPESDEEDTRQLMNTAVSEFVDAGIDESRITWETAQSDNVTEQVETFVSGYDLLIIGESEPSLASLTIGTIPERIINAVSIPVLVVRNQDDSNNVSQ
ncbi:universal stress protein [Salinarchaeum sp. IM2453]|uniref:universal stress protein n=1 Tax=Salinarchaeum sp. IM2453 TaxID=2862870 RepID=UPI001C83A940|nr:universal stress protein [Salinarchaeum sp. IM2453]QZA88133.1 universal stress protein [Salinarchaeum sp. IM2453]